MGRRILREKIIARLEELREAEREAVTRVQAIRVAIAELDALIAPEPTITHGELETPDA